MRFCTMLTTWLCLALVISLSAAEPSRAVCPGLSRGIEAGLKGALGSPSGVFRTSLDDDTLLSETVTLQLLLDCVKGDEDGFERRVGLLERFFLSPVDLLYWRLDPEGRPTDRANATVDDLRACRVLLDASRRWDRPAWRELARRIGESLLTNCTSDGLLADGTSWEKRLLKNSIQTPRPYLTLSYGDVPAMLLLADAGSRVGGWLPVAERTLGVLVLGLGGDAPPFWGYDADGGSFDRSDDNRINEMLLLLHLARAGVSAPELDDWWRIYRSAGAVPLPGGGENVAVEALFALALDEAGRRAEARHVVAGLGRFRLDGVAAGGLLGYHEPDGGVSAWAFDNLLALIALRTVSMEGGRP